MTSHTLERPRRRRYSREEKRFRPPFELTSRDIDLVALAYEYRFLTRLHYFQVYGENRRLEERIRRLHDHGLLDLVRPATRVREKGSARNIYALGDKGLDLLADERGVPRPRRLRQSDKNRAAKKPYIDHSLLTADLMVRFERADRDDIVRLIRGDEIAAAREGLQRDEQRRFQWKVDGLWKDAKGRMHTIPVPVNPDKVFGLELAGYPEGKNRLWFMVEADRGNEVQLPTRGLLKPLKTTIFHKYLGLYQTHQERKLLEELFGWNHFRVLTIASGPTRMQNMRKTAMLATGGRNANQFLFTDSATLAAHESDILELEWLTAAGEKVRLGE
jgi:DNA-binding PadR family transcriptional regulator